ncbi:MAG: LysR family transcriptional regulator [Polyangiaceae bacterium]|nr:LysR family transcriptional regulator [Polyangiaceae bacterium]
MIDLLRHFLLVADHGTFTAAARHAHLSQPALTSSVRRLEESVGGSRLFDRGRQGAALTEAGRALLPHARAAVVAVDEGVRAIAALEKLEAGEVRIGGGSTACTYLLPPILSVFRRKNPKVAIYLREMPELQVVDTFEAGGLDLAVVTGAAGESFRDEDVILVAPKGADPNALPFITFPTGSAVRELLDRYFPSAEITMELASISSAKGSVRAGLGKMLVSKSAVRTDLELGRLVEVPDSRTPIKRRLGLLHRGVERLSPAAAALRVLLLENAPPRQRASTRGRKEKT